MQTVRLRGIIYTTSLALAEESLCFPPESVHQQVTKSSHNPYRILKAVVDMMKQRYTSKDYEPLSFEEILYAVKFTDLRTDTKEWLHGVCVWGVRSVAVGCSFIGNVYDSFLCISQCLLDIFLM